MKKLILIILFTFNISYSQEIIASFSTNYMVSEMQGQKQTVELTLDWVLYENKIVGTYTDKKIIKQLVKMNQPVNVTFDLNIYQKDSTFNKDNYGNYFFIHKQNESSFETRFIITINQLIKITTKDTFSGSVSDISYVKI